MPPPAAELPPEPVEAGGTPAATPPPGPGTPETRGEPSALPAGTFETQGIAPEQKVEAATGADEPDGPAPAPEASLPPEASGQHAGAKAGSASAPQAAEPASAPLRTDSASVDRADADHLPQPRFGHGNQLAVASPSARFPGQEEPELPSAQAGLPEPAFGGSPQVQPDPLGDTALAGMSGQGLPKPRMAAVSSRLPGSAEPPSARLAGRDTSATVGLGAGSGSADFGPEDELILRIQTAGGEMADTIVAYGTRSGVFIPFGAFARFMDLAISVGDGGKYASGWFIDENRTLTLDLNAKVLTVAGKDLPLGSGDASAYEGELYLRAERYPEIFPLTLDVDLREQSITVKTLERFPFEDRIARESARGRLEGLQGRDEAPRWPREDTPYRALTFPIGDAELRALADSTLGKRLEADLRLAGDFAFMTAQTFVSGSSRDGITGARLQLGRRDPDADLLGPLKATEFQIGDVNTASLPLGLRGTGGRGAFIANTPLESASVFDKIDLRGELADGYEVELYRNNVLIDSTRSPVNGQYEFLQVPVDYGLNVFRFVFYGPQGQRREEVKRVSVGDGRLAKGQLVYAFGAVQKATNVFNVHGPLHSPVDDEGSWRGSALLQYGVTSGLTATLGGAWFESGGRKNWMATAGARTGIAGIATRIDFGVQSGGGKAVQLGLGGSLLGATYTLEHAEYSGRFTDEVNAISLNPLKRSTEINLNSTMHFGIDADALFIPLSARLQRFEYLNGLNTLEASLRASARVGGFMVSNTFDYERTSGANQNPFSQLRGSFDLATLSGSRVQFRAGADYVVMPRIKLSTVKLDVDYALDRNTLLRGSVSHGFDPSQTQFGLSAVRRLGKFTLAFDGNYGVPRREYSAALRLGFSFGRNPLTGRFFFGETGLSSGGAVAIRAFQDVNGDAHYNAGDTLLPAVEFGNGSNRMETDTSGNAFLGNLGDSRPSSFKVNLETLPDIALAPKSEGIEIVPRPGRIHVTDYAVRTLGEIEGTAYFGGAATSRGVSGLSLLLLDKDGKETGKARTEADGFFLFEQVAAGCLCHPDRSRPGRAAEDPPGQRRRDCRRYIRRGRPHRRYRGAGLRPFGPKTKLVGERGFEPPAPASRRQCSTRLSYSPTVRPPPKAKAMRGEAGARL